MATKLGAIQGSLIVIGGRQGSLLAGTGVFGLLTRRIEADFQCLRGDDHARDMALDEVAVRKSGRRPCFGH